MEQSIFPSDELIRLAGTGDLTAASELDHSGFLIQPGETAADYAKRVADVKRKGIAFFNHFSCDGKMEVYPGLSVCLKDKISQEIIEEAAAETEKMYQFSIRWVPGFFPEKEFGLFWGGCAVWQEDEPVPVIIIRRNFAKRKKWFIYDRTELISHELSHAARMPLMDGALEEHFAYALSKKWLRRTLGNCFQRDLDAIFFVIPALLLALVQSVITVFQITWLPIFPFWIFAFITPVYLIIRNLIQTGNYRAAAKVLKKSGYKSPRKILYRSVYSEICEIAKTKPGEISALLSSYAREEFRWKVILNMFQKTEKTEG